MKLTTIITIVTNLKQLSIHQTNWYSKAVGSQPFLNYYDSDWDYTKVSM